MVAYVNSTREVYDYHPEVLDEKSQADKEGNHTHSHSEAARIGIVVVTEHIT